MRFGIGIGVVAAALALPSAPSFGLQPQIGLGSAASSVPIAIRAADLNGDRLPDLAVTDSLGSVSVLYARRRSSFALENVPLKPASVALDGPWYSLAVGDLNGDGKPDLAVADAQGAVTILHNQTGSARSSDRTLQRRAIPGFALAGAIDLHTASNPTPVPWGVAIGDLDGDGKPDIVAADTSGNASVLLNRGAAGFTLREFSLATPTDPHPFSSAVAIGDLNGDGRPDLAFADQNANAVSVLLNEGGGAFALQPELDLVTASEPNPQPLAIAAGDLDGDGRVDLAVADLRGQGVSVLLNRGGGAFSLRQISLATHLEPHPFPDAVAIADLNGDGRRDLAVADGSGAMSVLLGRGGGRFVVESAARLRTTAEPFPGPTGIAVADVNGDGKPDVATSNQAGSVSLLLNRQPRLP